MDTYSHNERGLSFPGCVAALCLGVTGARLEPTIVAFLSQSKAATQTALATYPSPQTTAPPALFALGLMALVLLGPMVMPILAKVPRLVAKTCLAIALALWSYLVHKAVEAAMPDLLHVLWRVAA